ncbi:MAG: RNA-binding domain-containing protein [Candidatus Thermoplasmatota archaeon]
MAEIRVSARCFPTEDRDKVIGAIRNLFPDFSAEGDDPVTGSASSMERFAELLKRQRIRSAARAALRRGIQADRVAFALNKQVAAAGKVSFSEDTHALGDLEVSIITSNPDRVIDEVAPRSEAGAGEGR